MEEGWVIVINVCVLGQDKKESCGASRSMAGELQQSVSDELLFLFLEVHEMFPFASMCGV